MRGVKQLADGLWQLRGFPPNAINVFLTGTCSSTRPPARAGGGSSGSSRPRVTAHALTHAHPDHQGASKEVCERLGIPLWCGEATCMRWRPATSAREPNALDQPDLDRVWAGPPRKVDRALREGDEVAGFDGPRRARALARPRRLLARVRPRAVLGDVLNNMNVITGAPGLHEPQASSRPIRRATASRPGGSRRSSPRSPASGTARR